MYIYIVIMELKRKIETILEEEGLTALEFSERINSQEGWVHKLLRGDIKKLQKKSAVKINSTFPKYTVKWLMNIRSEKDSIKYISQEDKVILKKFEGITPQEVALYIVKKENDLGSVETFNLWLQTKVQQGVIKVLLKDQS